MSIEIRTVPAADQTFRETVRDAIAAVQGDPPPAGTVTAASEMTLRVALRQIRGRYPDVEIRRRDALSSVNGGDAWYVFRERT